MTRQWVPLMKFPGGMRYFRDAQSGMVAAADNSGRNPDLTDDGVMWLDTDRPISINMRDARVYVPVTSETGGNYICHDEIVNMPAFLPFWQELGGKVVLTGSVTAEHLRCILDHAS
jgi:hypothetical protein